MNDALEILSNVAQPLGLLAIIVFLGAVVAWQTLKRKVELLAKVPEAERGRLMDEFMTRYKVSGEDLTPSQRHKLLHEEMRGRLAFRKFAILVAAGVLVVCLALVLTAWLIKAPVPPVPGPEPPDPQTRAGTLVGLDQNTLTMIGHDSVGEAPGQPALFQISFDGGSWNTFDRNGLFLGTGEPLADALEARWKRTAIERDRAPVVLSEHSSSPVSSARVRIYSKASGRYSDCNGPITPPSGGDLWLIDAYGLCRP